MLSADMIMLYFAHQLPIIDAKLDLWQRSRNQVGLPRVLRGVPRNFPQCFHFSENVYVRWHLSSLETSLDWDVVCPATRGHCKNCLRCVRISAQVARRLGTHFCSRHGCVLQGIWRDGRTFSFTPVHWAAHRLARHLGPASTRGANASGHVLLSLTARGASKRAMHGRDSDQFLSRQVTLVHAKQRSQHVNGDRPHDHGNNIAQHDIVTSVGRITQLAGLSISSGAQPCAWLAKVETSCAVCVCVCSRPSGLTCGSWCSSHM